MSDVTIRSRADAEQFVSQHLFSLVSAEVSKTDADPAHQPRESWLPMPLPEGELRKVSLTEWLLHNKLQALQQTDQPGYGKSFWNRVTPETAALMWELLAEPMGLKLSDLWAPWPAMWEPTLEEQADLMVRTQQAVAVVMATAANLGKDHRLLTVNSIMEALYAAWSDHWRQIRKEERASVAWHLTPEDVLACHRDLLRWRISPDRLWHMLVTTSAKSGGNNPLFYLELASQPDDEMDEGMTYVEEDPQADKKRKPRGAYVVRLRDTWSPDWKRFESLLLRDAHYGAPCYQNPFGKFPILTSAKPHAPIVKRDILAEQPYNIAQYGAETERVIKLLESSVQILDVAAFRRDYELALEVQDKIEQALKLKGLTKSVLSTHHRRVRGKLQHRSIRDHALDKAEKNGLITAEDRPVILADLTRYDDAAWITKSFGKAYQQTESAIMPVGSPASLVLALLRRESTGSADPARPLWQVRSHFTKSLNRRYQPTHFHLSAITKNPWSDAEVSQSSPGNIMREVRYGGDKELEKGLRFRWMKGLSLPHSNEPVQDLVGLDVKASQTQIIALFAGLRELEDSFTNEGDFRKDLLAPAALSRVQAGYTGPDDPKLIALIKNTTMTRFYGSRLAGPYGLVQKQYDDPSGYGPGWMDSTQADIALDAMPDREGMEKFLLAARRLALVAFNLEGSVTLTDLLDAQCPGGGKFTWNPRPFSEKQVWVGDKFGVTVGVPKVDKAGNISTRSISAKTQNLLGPCWVHSADSYYLSLVVTKLAGAGVPSFGAIHDCLVVPKQVLAKDGSVVSGLQVLRQVMDAAARDWFRGLGPMYDDLIRYLGTDAKVIPMPKGWRGEWTRETYGAYAHRLKDQWTARLAAIEAGEQAWPTFAVSPT